jgi:hypothetical protein
MYHATQALNKKASTRGKRREAVTVIVELIMEGLFVRVTQIKKLQSAFKQLVDFFLADFLRREEGMKVEVRESAIGDPGREKLAQAAGIDGAELANLLEDNASQGILKDIWIEQPADFAAGSTLDQDGAQEAQRVPFKQLLADGF